MTRHMQGSVTRTMFAAAVVMMMTATAAADPPAAAPTAAPAAVDRIDRLLGLARIWAEVKYFHPAMYQRAIDWDGALIKVLPEVEAASDAASYRTAIGHLLAAVGDPRTMVEPDVREDPAPAAPGSTTSGGAQSAGRSSTDAGTWTGNGVLVLDARLKLELADVGGMRRIGREARAAIAKARVVVIDLRDRRDDDDRLLRQVIESLPATRDWPTLRSVEHHGFRSQGETNRDTYTTSWEVLSSGAPTPGGRPGPSHVVFAVDPRHALPVAAAALWLAGHATLVSPTTLDDSVMASIKHVALPYDISAQYRTADVVLPGGRGLAADVVVGRGEDVRARAIAIAGSIATGGAPPRAPERHASRTNPDDLRLVDDDASPDSGLPSRERRILAAIRAWATIEYFHGTPYLVHDWDRALRAALPRVEAAADATGYRDALLEMLVPLRDGHAVIYPIGEPRRSGTAIFWRRIEGKLIAGGLRDEAAARQAGIALGDELVSIDGVPAEQAVARALRTVALGTDESTQQWGIETLDRGTRDTAIEVVTRNANGKLHRATLTRRYGDGDDYYAHPGAPYRVLPGDIGYADLTRLTTDDIDPMFEALRATRAIVFDMRGYPKGTGALISDRIHTRTGDVRAEFRTPLVTARTVKSRAMIRVLQPFLATDKPVYRKKIIVLIDDRAVSAGEHTCLAIEAASGATFIGSPTSGTNGEETYVQLPGGLELRFTGQEVRHADGRQLQQIGIQPQITVRPTLRGLRAGKDEVLDRAIRYLQTGK